VVTDARCATATVIATANAMPKPSNRRWGSPYRHPDGRETTIGRMVRHAILQAGGTERS
jgi:hypothetical protein